MPNVMIALIAAAAVLWGCATQPPAASSPAAAAAPVQRWIALPHEAPPGQLVSWSSGPFLFVMRYGDVLTALDDDFGDASHIDAVRAALLAHANEPDGGALYLNEVFGPAADLHVTVGFLVAGLLETRRASLIDTERGFVVGSVSEITETKPGRRARRFETRDGRKVLRVVDRYYSTGWRLMT